jgi:hypothetical protein
MRAIRTIVPLVTMSVLCACALSAAEARQAASQAGQRSAQPDGQQVTVPLSDPSRPATLAVRLVNGGVTIRGTNRKDILIDAEPSDQRRRGRGRGGVYIDSGGGGTFIVRGGRSGRGGGDGDTSGLKRLTQTPGFTVEGDNNQIQLSSGGNGNSDFVIEVPTRINLKVSTVNDGPIVIENVDGELEVNNTNDSVTLTNVAGSVVANAHNGFLKVVMTRLAGDKAMAFTSFNGNVDVTLPSSTKATLKLRSEMGEIYTDFDVQVRPIVTTPQNVRGADGRIHIDVNRSIQGAVNGGGPEFEFRTFNGNIFLRKGAQ